MKIIKQFIWQHKIISPTIAVVLLISSFFSVSQLIAHSNQQKENKHVLAAKVQITPTPTVRPTDTLSPTQQPTVFIASQNIAIKQSPTPTPISKQSSTTSTPQSTQNTSQSNNTQSQPTPTPTIIPTNVLPTATQTPIQQPTTVPAQTVNIQITDPDGTKNFQVTLHNGDNLCDNLTEAKNEGKIKSLTLDSSYMSVYHSLYVREIDSYNNNWTVAINGTEPQGCSLFNPKPNDTIVWKFL